MRERFVDSDGVKIHVVEEGPQDGKPVLFVHGFPEFWWSWRHQMERVRRAGYRAVALDLRGFGDSDRPDDVASYALPNSVGDVSAVIDSIGGRAALVSHDWGGALGWAYTAFVPDKVERLVVMNAPHPNAYGDLPKHLDQLQKSWYMFFFQFEGVAEDVMSRNNYELLRTWWYDTATVKLSEEEIGRYVEVFSRPGALTAGLNWYRANVQPASYLSGQRLELPPITCPAMLLWGLDDAYLTFELGRRAGEFCTGPFALHALAGHRPLDPAGAPGGSERAPPQLPVSVTAQISLERSVLITVGLGGMLIPLNSTMVAVALPNITSQLDASVAQSGWLVTAYLIVMAAFQPIAGKLGDRYGRRVFLLGGYTTFALASVGSALSRSVLVLIAFRAGQALAGSVIFPNGAALLRTIVPEERRGARFGLLGSSIAFGAAIGPPLGGVLVGIGGWPAIFWANLPLCIVVIAIALRTIPADSPSARGVSFDFLGSALLALVLSVGAWLLTRITDVGANVALLTGAGLVVVAVAFLAHELRHDDPVVQPRFFRRRTFAAATSGIALSNLGLYVLLLAVPLLLVDRPDWSETRIGLVLTSMSAGMVLLAPIGGRLADRVGRRTPAVVGMSLLAAGVTTIAIGGPDISPLLLVGALALAGTGLGMGSGSLQTSAVESIEPEHAGMAAGASSTSRYLGSIVGVAVLAGVVTGGGGLQPVLTMTAAAAIGSVVLAFGLPSRRPGSSPAQADGVSAETV